MLDFFSSLLCTSKYRSLFTWELLGELTYHWELNYDFRVTSVEWTWLGLGLGLGWSPA